MARFYQSTDAGAPVLDIPASAGAVDIRRFGCLKQILKAALVNGYGSGGSAKPAAGWALIQEGDRTITLRNASGSYVTFSSFYLFMSPVNYSGDMYYRIYLHNTFTGIVNGVPQGEGVVTGTAAGNSVPHYCGSTYQFQYANTALWTMLADDRSFWFMHHCNPYGNFTNVNVQDSSLATGSWNNCFYVGDDSQGSFIAVGGQLTSAVNAITAPYFDHQAITTLRNPHTGLLIDTGGAPATTQVVSLFSISVSTGATVFYKDVMNMCPIEWACASKYAGNLRGGFLDVMSGHSRGDIIYRALIQDVSPVRATHIMTPSLMADGYSYLVPMSQTNQGRRCVISDNPDLW